MYTIDVAKVIETRGLNSSQVASLLFPSNKHPQKALDRVIEGKSKLDSEQVALLAHLAQLPIATLYTEEGWSCRSRGHVHTMTNGDYTAVLDMSVGMLIVFQGAAEKPHMYMNEGTLQNLKIGADSKHVCIVSKSIELGELIETINNIIHKNETKN